VYRHWLVTLQGLPDSGRTWDENVARHLLEDTEHGTVDALSGLCGDIHWNLSLEHQNDLFHLHGRWHGAVRRACSRCNVEFDWQVDGRTECDFQIGSCPLEDESESEYLSVPGKIDLLDVLRENIWLAWKADVICSDSCRGLCPKCGCNLNTQVCQCGKEDSDHPFASLRKLKLGV
jgi:uncharacterized protein